MHRSTFRAAWCFASVVLAISLAPVAAEADLVFGNLGPSGTNAVDSISANVIGRSGTNNTFVAMAFVTGTSVSYNLTQMQLGLGNPSGFPQPRILVTTDSGNLPHTIIGALTTTSLTSNALYNFTPTASISLSGGTKYWFVVADLNAESFGTQFSWFDNFDGDFPTAQNGSGFSYPSPNATKSFIYPDGQTSASGTWNTFNAGRTASFSMMVTAVPEPSTYALASVGLGLAGLVRARRRKSRN